jgi:hypothetical protein
VAGELTMALLQNTTAQLGSDPSATKQTESIFTAQEQKSAPTKVSGRPVEVVAGGRTVQGQLNSILSSGSPLMRQAKARAAMESAGRGLNNSSIAVEAGEQAMISSALPIAQQDAGQEHQLFMQDKDHTFTGGENEKGRQFTAGENAADRTLRQSMQLADHSFQSGENSANRAFQSGESAAERDFRIKQEDRAQAFQVSDREDQQQFQAGETAAERAARLESDRQQREFTAEQSRLADERNLSSNKELSSQGFEQSRSLQELEAKNQLAMEDIRFEHQQTINSSAIAQTIYQNHQSAVANIMSQPGMTPSQAGAALQILNQTTKDNLTLAGALSGVDLSAFAPSGAVSGTSTTDKKGNVTNVFNANQSQSGAGADQARSNWLSEEIEVQLSGFRGNGGKTKMTRAEAIKQGYIKDDYQA